MQDDQQMAVEAAALRRIVALLLGLADLAERLCGVPRFLRCYVLAILRAAEAVAQTIVERHAPLNGASTQPMLRPDADGAEDALRLASGFRAMASALSAPVARLCADWRACGIWMDIDEELQCLALAGSRIAELRRTSSAETAKAGARIFLWDSS